VHRAAAVPAQVAVLPTGARLAAGVLRTFARASLLWMAAAIALGDAALPAKALEQIRTFLTLFLAPEAAAWSLLRAFKARLGIEHGVLVLASGRQHLELAIRDIVAVEPWRIPVPGPGASLRLASGLRWKYGVALEDPSALAHALQAAGGASLQEMPRSRASAYLGSRLAIPRGRLARPLAKFVLLPLALAIPAFRLHQYIAFGSAFGEVYTFGWVAYLKGFALWWAAWAIGVVLYAALLRALIEAGTISGVLLKPAASTQIRRWLERVGLAALYLGLPTWLLFRLLAP
jgi:apolipoprotein N-acyltransferase